ncbi:hypothetical protein B8V81_4016 [Paenibacillus pasadenensis]|uniref:Uncharacterized protein n=1 Tax=Paenibacillus pasadenensis TaxID=217090 RepID=A0A2N5N5I2_9BACL|nr:hypothetical protein B8V81_4016 [Paenibacillus pasadenensis]
MDRRPPECRTAFFCFPFLPIPMEDIPKRPKPEPGRSKKAGRRRPREGAWIASSPAAGAACLAEAPALSPGAVICGVGSAFLPGPVR